MKLPARAREIFIREKLAELTRRGIDGEKESARAALDRLSAKYDFETAPAPDPDAPDIFASVRITPAAEGENHRLQQIDPGDLDLASFVKWTLAERFQVSGFFRAQETELWVNARRADMPALRHLADVIRKNFRRLWSDFAAVPGVQPGARAPFLTGLYDGMMSDERPAGQMLPATRAERLHRGDRKRTLTRAPGVAIHPYSLALELGRKIRLAVPLQAITREIQSQVSAAQIPEEAAV